MPLQKFVFFPIKPLDYHYEEEGKRGRKKE